MRMILLAVVLFAPSAFARPLHSFDDLTIAANGTFVASIEHDEPDHDGDEPVEALVIRSPGHDRNPVTIELPCAAGPDCKPASPAISPDGNTVAFILSKPHDDRQHLYEAGTDGTGIHEILSFAGTLGGLRFSPTGKLALLAVAGAHKQIGAIKAAAPLAGEIGIDDDEQRIAVLDGQQLHFVSPADLFVYEFDWRPDGSGFIGTAASGNGDNSWWKAKLWSFSSSGIATVLYTPPANRQLASPLVSADGTRVAFIGGIMSDFGSTGGDAFVLKLGDRAAPVDVTPEMPATVTGLSWHCRGRDLTGTVLQGDRFEIVDLDRQGHHPPILWAGEQTISTGPDANDVACGGSRMAAIHQGFTTPPEIGTAGDDGTWTDLTTVNQGITEPVAARSLTWKSDRNTVQGWLLTPTDRKDNDNQRMITEVHGGPSAASTPLFPTEHRGLWLLQAGYDVFLPNPRGSFGQGEAYTMANVKDFGGGDLRDILRGVDQAMRIAPISPDGLGITGYSYGGYMTMWAVTQTNRFKVAVAGAGISDWQSYYGENGIDQWMIPFFGASVYDDPAVYRRSSPITFIKNVHTPTFEFVGDRDVECPLPQTEEFWHALYTLGVPTKFVVYPGQGHELHDAKDRADVKRRTLAWFARYLGPKT